MLGTLGAALVFAIGANCSVGAILSMPLAHAIAAHQVASLVEQAATPEPRERAITYAVHDGLELGERWRRRAAKHDAMLGHVHVHVQVQTPPEALHEGDRAALAAPAHASARARSVETEDRVDEGLAIARSTSSPTCEGGGAVSPHSHVLSALRAPERSGALG
jgi:hypothetical protein